MPGAHGMRENIRTWVLPQRARYSFTPETMKKHQ